jgi:bifunctional non-homologous end joining protein LigD
MSKNLKFGDRLFAVREHDSSFLHWDLRIHFSGQTVLSFVLRTPPHLDPAKSLKAKRVGDHKLDYLLIERIIPLGWPGAGPTVLWDQGVFRILGKAGMALQLSRGHLRILVMGKRLQGIFSLKWIGPGENDWLWIKVQDSYAAPSIRFPNVLTPDKIEELERKAKASKNHDLMELFENF